MPPIKLLIMSVDQLDTADRIAARRLFRSTLEHGVDILNQVTGTMIDPTKQDSIPVCLVVATGAMVPVLRVAISKHFQDTTTEISQ